MSNERIFKVVNPNRVAWAVRFKTEEAAWGRLFALKGKLKDTPKNRQAMVKEGWRVEDVTQLAA